MIANTPKTGYIPSTLSSRLSNGGFMLRSLRIMLTSALTINLAIGPTLLSAEGSPPDIPPITIRSNTRLVVVDVVVTDKKGQSVAGLKAEDFTVEENGKKQKVSV